MGFLSKIVKGVKNIFKGIKKVVKKVWKGVKTFAKSKIGKIVIAAAAIYFGGLAIEAWGSGASTAATTATELAASTIPTVAETAAATSLGSVAAPSALGLAPTLATPALEVAALAPSTIAAATAVPAAAPGLLSQIGSAAAGAGEWMTANPIPTMMAGQLATAAFTPSAAENQAEMDEQRRRNSNIAGVGYYGEGDAIGLAQRAQQQDLQSPTYQYKPSGG